MEKDDNLPKVLCCDCIKNLETCYGFQKQIASSYHELQKWNEGNKVVF